MFPFLLACVFVDAKSQQGCKHDESRTDKKGQECERLAIFGLMEGRRGAELKAMGAVETKQPGHFTSDLTLPVVQKQKKRKSLLN